MSFCFIVIFNKLFAFLWVRLLTCNFYDCLWISSLNSMQIYVWSVNWCVCASVCFSPASSLARGCSLTLQLYIKPKTQVKVYVSVPFKDLSLSSHPATAVTSSNNSVYIWGCMGTCVTRSWALRMDWVGKKHLQFQEFQLVTKVVFVSKFNVWFCICITTNTLVYIWAHALIKCYTHQI